MLHASSLSEHRRTPAQVRLLNRQPHVDPSLSFLSLDKWQSFVESCEDSTAFHHRHWIELIAKHYRWKTQIPAIERDGRIAAAIPFIETTGILGTKKLISLPFTDCVPPLGNQDDTRARLLDALRVNPRFKGHAAIVVRSDEPIPAIACESHWYRHVLDIGRPMADIEATFSQSLGRNLRKAESTQLTFHRRTDGAAVEVFYKLHVITRKKLGVPVQPKKFFLQLHTNIIAQGLGYVGIVLRGNRPIAAAVFLTYKQTLTYKYGASDPEFLRVRPNEFLLYNAIAHANKQGLRRFDFGVTAKDNEGLRKFKLKWGSSESQAYHVYLAGQPSPTQSKSRILAFSSVVIRNSPTAVCRGLGEVFYKFSQ